MQKQAIGLAFALAFALAAVLGSGGLAMAAPLPMAAALPAPDAPLQASPAHVSTQAQVVKPQVCFTDVFSDPLPGRADYCLGMQDWSKGDRQSALQFFKLAAGWGNKHAQYTLGLIHYGGHHVPTDVVLGLAWLKLADERHNDPQIGLVKRSAFASATPLQRRQAENLYRKMQGQYGDEVAAARAWHHLQRWRHHNRYNSGCIRLRGPEAAAAKRVKLAGVPPQSIAHTLFPSYPIASYGAPKGTKEGNKVHRKRIHFSKAKNSVCVTLQMQHHVAQQLAQTYFAGTPWMGSVTVEPLQQVPASATSSRH